MAVLTAAVIVVGALCLVDLLLTFGIVRRLREHTALLSSHQLPDVSVSDLGVGEVPGSFEAEGTDGQPLEGPAGWRMVAFFSSSCSICPTRAPLFADYVRTSHAERDTVLAVVVKSAGEPVPYLDLLAAVAHVCLQPDDGQLSNAFGVTGYPAFCLLDETGAVQAVHYDPAALPALAPA
jgi:hypothetical protein